MAQIGGTCQRAKSIGLTGFKIVDQALETVPKNLEKRFDELEIRGGFENIQTTALQKSAKILKRVMNI